MARTKTPGFESFDAFWSPLAKGQGLSSTYRDRLTCGAVGFTYAGREKLLGTGADRPFRLKAKALALRRA